jgi:hypothetical protein
VPTRRQRLPARSRDTVATSNHLTDPTGPWFSTQLMLSLSIGLTSFFVFCFLRTRWEVVYMGRTKLKGE